MQQTKLVRPLAVVAAIFMGIALLSAAAVEKRRAGLVKADPEVITCRQLVQQPTPENRHLRITDGWLGFGFVYLEKRRSPDWDFVYVPLYPQQVEQEDEGQQIRLLARISNIRNEDELNALRQNSEIAGCLWDDHTVRSDIQAKMREFYPRIDLAQCRIVHVGERLPTLEGARLNFILGCLAFVVAVGVALWLIVEWLQFRAGVVSPAEQQDAYQQGPAAAEPPTPPTPPAPPAPSTAGAAWQEWAVRIGAFLTPAAIVAGLVFYVLRRVGLVSADFGMIGMTACVAVLFIGGGVTLALLGRYREYEHQLLPEDQLPRRVRKSFERQTPELLRLGFEYLGDVKLTTTCGIIVRQFLSQDGRSLAFLESGFGMTAHSFLSITSDGVCLETASLDNTELENTTLPKRRQAFKGSLEATFHAHEDFVLEHASQQNVRVLAVEPDQIPALMDYEHRVSAWSMYKAGLFKSSPPPIPVFESISQLKTLREERLRRLEGYELAS